MAAAMHPYRVAGTPVAGILLARMQVSGIPLTGTLWPAHRSILWLQTRTLARSMPQPLYNLSLSSHHCLPCQLN
jgi:hypothetical protein